MAAPKRFSTADILNYFTNLLNPDQFQNLNALTKKELVAAAHDLAQIGFAIEDTISPRIKMMKMSLATPGTPPDTPPPKTEPQRLASFTQLKEFADKHVTALNITIDKTLRELLKLEERYDKLTEYNSQFNPNELMHLTADIQKLKNGDVKAILERKESLMALLDPIESKVRLTSGGKIVEEMPEEIKAGPSPSN